MKHECLTLGHGYPIGGPHGVKKKSGGFFSIFFLEGVFYKWVILGTRRNILWVAYIAIYFMGRIYSNIEIE